MSSPKTPASSYPSTVPTVVISPYPSSEEGPSSPGAPVPASPTPTAPVPATTAPAATVPIPPLLSTTPQTLPIPLSTSPQSPAEWLDVAKKYDGALRAVEKTSSPYVYGKVRKDAYAKVIVEGIMRGTQAGGNGSVMFPRMFHLIDKYRAPTVRIFSELYKSIRMEEFVRWLSHLLAMFRTAHKSLRDVVKDIIHHDPQGSYWLVSARWCLPPFVEDALDLVNKEALRAMFPVQRELKAMDKLRMELQRLVHPRVALKWFIDDVQRILESDLPTKQKRSWVSEQFIIIDNYVLTRPLTADMGEVALNIGDAEAQGTKDVCGDRGVKLFGATAEATFEELWVTRMRVHKGELPSGDAPLARYSPSLAAYDGNKHEVRLQVPGTNPPRHIQKFGQTIEIIHSARHPKRLTMIDFENVEHHFLYKDQEDIRVDEGVQDLLGLCQRIMDADPECVARQTRIKPLQVFPLSAFSGLIKWIPSTSLMTALRRNHEYREKDGAAVDKIQARALEQCTAEDERPHVSLFRTSKKSMRRLFNSLAMKTPFLLNWIRQQAREPLAPAELIQNFGRSYATISTCLYVLGVGDRHYGNFLMTPSGDVVAIDFDLMFGEGFRLDVPELAPIRYSPLIQHVIDRNTMAALMTVVLKALEENRESIIDALRMFYFQPPSTWISTIGREIVPQNNFKLTKHAREVILDRLEEVRERLQGRRAEYIIVDEIDSKHGEKSWFPDLVAILKGTQRETGKAEPRASLPEYCTTVNDQVESILEIAGDGSITIRQFEGWAAWA